MKVRRRGGWRRRARSWQAYVRLHSGRGGLRTQWFPLDTSPAALQGWIDDTLAEARRRSPKGPRGTLAGDVAVYLKLLAHRPQLQKERAHQLAWWCARFPQRTRWSLSRAELETALSALLAAGKAASTVRKYRTALFHLCTKLDGKDASNPLRDVPPPREPEPLARALPYALLAPLFAAMPDRGQAVRFGKRPLVSKTKLRLQVMAYTGLPPAQIMRLQSGDVDLEGGTVLVRGRRKGAGARAVRLPLTADGRRALTAFVAAAAWGRFSMSSAARAFHRAAKALVGHVAASDWRAAKALFEQLREARPYDLRHTLLSAAYLVSGDIHATQQLALHADPRMTHRYTLGAVDARLQRVADLLSAWQPVVNESARETERIHDFPQDRVGGVDGLDAAKPTTKA